MFLKQTKSSPSAVHATGSCLAYDGRICHQVMYRRIDYYILFVEANVHILKNCPRRRVVSARRLDNVFFFFNRHLSAAHGRRNREVRGMRCHDAGNHATEEYCCSRLFALWLRSSGERGKRALIRLTSLLAFSFWCAKFLRVFPFLSSSLRCDRNTK